jgi:uncharacterized protein (TIGR02996 family)
MTEDEAFVRTVVDSPGDDLPRLVYADWLDDRGDPRGAYLRAEAEWAKAKQTAGFMVLRLHGMATLLDRLWVARISRPPLGVCCDPKFFTDSGIRLNESDIASAEQWVGLPITGEYRAFLLNMNGGIPRFESHFGADSSWRIPDQCFYSVGDRPNVRRQSLVHQAHNFQTRNPAFDYELHGLQPGDLEWREDVLPIGDFRDFTLFYAVRGVFAGRLHLHDFTGEFCAFGWIAGPHGPPTFAEYLYRLVEHGNGLTDTYPSQPLQEFWRR